MRCRRVIEPGASYFFTLVLHERQRLFADDAHVERWHRAVAKVRRIRPFEIEAEVILPDHLHVLWVLPRGDGDYATRIKLVKTHFTKSLEMRGTARSTSESRKRKGERD